MGGNMKRILLPIFILLHSYAFSIVEMNTSASSKADIADPTFTGTVKADSIYSPKAELDTINTDSLHSDGDVIAVGNIRGATYGSDGSISDAELLTLDDGATTEILVGGGAGSAPVWTTATGTGAPVRATAPTLTGLVTVNTSGSAGGMIIDGNKTTGNLLLVTNENSGGIGDSTGLVVDNSGNVGIGGATLQGKKLYVVGSATISQNIDVNGSMYIRNTSDTRSGFILYKTDWSKGGALEYQHSGYLRLFTTEAEPIIFSPGSVERVRIDGLGNIAAGTSVADSKVTINSETGAILEGIYNDTDGSPANKFNINITSGGDMTINPSGGDIYTMSAINTLSDTSTVGTQFGAVSSELTAYTDNMIVTVIMGIASPGASTFRINALPELSIKTLAGDDPAANWWEDGYPIQLMYRDLATDVWLLLSYNANP
jgi:hypothetical protein